MQIFKHSKFIYKQLKHFTYFWKVEERFCKTKIQTRQKSKPQFVRKTFDVSFIGRGEYACLPDKIRLYISCGSSAVQTIQMKCQVLFSLIIIKKSECHLVQICVVRYGLKVICCHRMHFRIQQPLFSFGIDHQRVDIRASLWTGLCYHVHFHKYLFILSNGMVSEKVDYSAWMRWRSGFLTVNKYLLRSGILWWFWDLFLQILWTP